MAYYFLSFMILTDTHAHLYSEEFDADGDVMMQRALQDGVKRFFLPNIDSTSIEKMLAFKKLFPENCFPMMGLHPCSVKENYKDELSLVEQWLAKEKFCAVGEIGIDLYWDKTFFEQQKDAFTIQAKWACERNLPLVIHTRNSFQQVYDLLLEIKSKIANPDSLRGIFHCFSSTSEDAKKVIELGFYLGIGGVVTFKNSGLNKIVSSVDLKHIVLETDAPYLAPVPHRGKRNEPSYLPLVARKIAALHNTTLEEVAKITTENSRHIFGI